MQRYVAVISAVDRQGLPPRVGMCIRAGREALMVGKKRP